MVAACWAQRSWALGVRPKARSEGRLWRLALAVEAPHGVPHSKGMPWGALAAAGGEPSAAPQASMHLIEEKEVVNRAGTFDTFISLC